PSMRPVAHDGDGGVLLATWPHLPFHLRPAARRHDAHRRDPATEPALPRRHVEPNRLPVRQRHRTGLRRLRALHHGQRGAARAHSARLVRRLLRRPPAAGDLRHQPRMDRQAAGADATVPRRQDDLLRARRRLGDGLARAPVPQQCLRAHPPFNNPAERATVYTRVEALANANRLVGFAWHAPREVCYSESAERVLILEYDLLAARPGDVFKLVYEHLGEKPFRHDFDKLEYDAPAFDAQLGLDGLHRVRPQVKPQQRRTILPPDLFARYAQLSFWRDLKESKAFRIVGQGGAEKQRDTTPVSEPAIAPEAAS